MGNFRPEKWTGKREKFTPKKHVFTVQIHAKEQKKILLFEVGWPIFGKFYFKKSILLKILKK
jgi:hypothetical protein